MSKLQQQYLVSLDASHASCLAIVGTVAKQMEISFIQSSSNIHWEHIQMICLVYCLTHRKYCDATPNRQPMSFTERGNFHFVAAMSTSRLSLNVTVAHHNLRYMNTNASFFCLQYKTSSGIFSLLGEAILCPSREQTSLDRLPMIASLRAIYAHFVLLRHET